MDLSFVVFGWLFSREFSLLQRHDGELLSAGNEHRFFAIGVDSTSTEIA
ncbi:MAG: hypothetical protein OXG88_07605 [Gammaproteobacteria bacterium]|nr:hypothetical protein [Gammaproteobacteria bacterium]